MRNALKRQVEWLPVCESFITYFKIFARGQCSQKQKCRCTPFLRKLGKRIWFAILCCVLLEMFAPSMKDGVYISSLTSNIYYDVWKLVSRTLTLVRQIYDWRMIMISMAFDVNYLTTWFVVSSFVTVLSIWLCHVFDYGGKGLTYWTLLHIFRSLVSLISYHDREM